MMHDEVSDERHHEDSADHVCIGNITVSPSCSTRESINDDGDWIA